MMERTHIHKALLYVELYEISSNFIYRLRNEQNKVDRVFDLLPKYTINSNDGANNRLILAYDHHQWVGMSENESDEKYLYFNLHSLDSTLNEEIINIGEENIFKNLDFKEILSNFTPESAEDIRNFVFPRPNYLIVELIYMTSYDNYGGGYETDVDIDIVGYLNNNLSAVYF